MVGRKYRLALYTVFLFVFTVLPSKSVTLYTIPRTPIIRYSGETIQTRQFPVTLILYRVTVTDRTVTI